MFMLLRKDLEVRLLRSATKEELITKTAVLLLLNKTKTEMQSLDR